MKNTVNDIHSGLNPTDVHEVRLPRNRGEILEIVNVAREQGKKLSVCGGRGSMGGQQFQQDGILIDLSAFNQVLAFSESSITVESGMDWPRLHEAIHSRQKNQASLVSFRQKQTGADFLTIGGSLSSNVHGRGLVFPPIISDVISFHLLDAQGKIQKCSRSENAELFSLAIGGYGLFGIILDVELRLYPRIKLRRDVEIVDLQQLPALAKDRVNAGYLYGDFQFSTDEKSENFLRRGVCTAYLPVDEKTPISATPKELSEKQWADIYLLAHRDRAALYKMYTDFYLSTAGQIYWSDTHQMSVYLKHYHDTVDKESRAAVKGSEMITEIYVSHEMFPKFMESVRKDFLQDKTPLIYGTVRLIKKDSESFLAWAKEDWACVIFNLHVDHDPVGISKAQAQFRKLIERGLEHGGSFYLTYHRWATKAQLEKAYPRIEEFFAKKRRYDPQEIFSSTWYEHYCKLFGDSAP
jgi:FAD/FMN-containing dehydrogenase